MGASGFDGQDGNAEQFRVDAYLSQPLPNLVKKKDEENQLVTLPTIPSIPFREKSKKE